MKMLRFLLGVTLVVFVSMAIHSCKPGVPKDVVKMSKMEDVLYDYHLSLALSGQFSSDSIDYYTRYYQQSVLKKHGLDKSEFVRSMEYYERHTDKLKKIYKNLSERFGGSVDGPSSYLSSNLAQQALKGDTLSVWRGPTEVLLSSQGVNRFMYVQRCDTTFHVGDQLQMSFNADWFYHDGERRAVAQVVVRYEGDSVAVMNHYFYTSGLQFMSLTVGKRRVERIDCIVYQCAPWSERARILKLSSIKMYRLRNRATKENKSLDTDTIGRGASKDSVKKNMHNPRLHVRDSLIKEEQENERRSHFI